jgi:hypothetical protein
MPETGIQRIGFHLAECHEGDNEESSSEMRASLSELPPHLTMLVEGCGRDFHQAATSHLHGRHRDADAKSDGLRMSADVGPTTNLRVAEGDHNFAADPGGQRPGVSYEQVSRALVVSWPRNSWRYSVGLAPHR